MDSNITERITKAALILHSKVACASSHQKKRAKIILEKEIHQIKKKGYLEFEGVFLEKTPHKL